MNLDRSTPDVKLDGPRSPLPHELEGVVDLVNTVFSPEYRTMGLEFPQLLSSSNLERLRVFVDPATGAVTAHAGYVAQELIVEGFRIPVAALGSVCTLPQYRGFGLASQLVKSIMNQAAAEGLALMLISGDSGVYKRLGATETGDFVRVEAQRDELNRLRTATGAYSEYGNIAVRPASVHDVPDMARVYRREPVRYARSLKDFDELTWWRPDVRRLYGFEQAWIAAPSAECSCRRGKPGALAYVVTRLRTLGDGTERLHVVEFAGSRRCVMQLIAYACTETDPDLLTATLCASDHELITLLGQAGLSMRGTNLPGYTVMALDPGTLLNSIVPMIAERFGLTAEGIGDDLTGPELVRMLFGAAMPAGGGMPNPVPLPVPGLNYI